MDNEDLRLEVMRQHESAMRQRWAHAKEEEKKLRQANGTTKKPKTSEEVRAFSARHSAERTALYRPLAADSVPRHAAVRCVPGPRAADSARPCKEILMFGSESSAQYPLSAGVPSDSRQVLKKKSVQELQVLLWATGLIDQENAAELQGASQKTLREMALSTDALTKWDALKEEV